MALKNGTATLNGVGNTVGHEAAIVAYDTFTDTDGVLLANHTSDSSHTWEDFEIQGNFFDLQVDAVELNI